jgi:hypothetical protein
MRVSTINLRDVRQAIEMIVGAIVGAGLVGWGAWWLWPTGITEAPLAALTLREIGAAALSILAWAFTPFALILGAAANGRSES